MTPFSNQAWIGTPIVFRHLKIVLVENSGDNIYGFFRDVECPSRETMPQQMGANRYSTLVECLKDQSVHEKPENGSSVVLMEPLVTILEEITIRRKTVPMVAPHGNDWEVLPSLWINMVVFTEHEFDQSQQPKVLIVEVIDGRDAMAFGDGTHRPMNAWCSIRCIGSRRKSNVYDAVR